MISISANIGIYGKPDVQQVTLVLERCYINVPPRMKMTLRLRENESNGNKAK